MTENDNTAKDALIQDLEHTARAAKDLLRDTVELTQATAAGTWHLTQILADAAARTTHQIAREAARTDGSGEPRRRHDAPKPSGSERPPFERRSPESVGTDAHVPPTQRGDTVDAELRMRGDELLYRSADARARTEPHPAYERILRDLAPDEARILRFLALHGDQPSVDVRTGRPFGVGSAKTGEGLSMIGELAGCRHVDRSHAYFNNLNRLGLVWFSKEPVELHRYQVVEAQPAVLEAARKAGRAAKIVRRSITLTPFGQDLCQTCFTLDAEQ